MELGLPPHLCEIFNLTYYRKLKILHQGNLIDERYTFKGVPQGSILSPILFNIYLRKLRKVLCDDCEIIQFADDIAIFSSSPKPEIALSIIEKVANKTYRFLNSKGLTVSPDKSALISLKKSLQVHTPSN